MSQDEPPELMSAGECMARINIARESETIVARLIELNPGFLTGDPPTHPLDSESQTLLARLKEIQGTALGNPGTMPQWLQNKDRQ